MKTESIRTPWANDGIIKNSGSHPAPYGDYEPAPLKNGVVSPPPSCLPLSEAHKAEDFFCASIFPTGGWVYGISELNGYIEGISDALSFRETSLEIEVRTIDQNGNRIQQFSGTVGVEK